MVGVGVTAGVEACVSGAEIPTNAVFGDCFEHALTMSRIPRRTNPASMAIFCWRDHEESVVPE